MFMNVTDAYVMILSHQFDIPSRDYRPYYYVIFVLFEDIKCCFICSAEIALLKWAMVSNFKKDKLKNFLQDGKLLKE